MSRVSSINELPSDVIISKISIVNINYAQIQNNRNVGIPGNISIYQYRKMADAEPIEFNINIKREIMVAEFTVTQGVNEYSGTFEAESARVHSGELINDRNFIDLIQHCAALSEPARVITIAPNGAKATVTMNFEVEYAGCTLKDSISVICGAVEISDSDRKWREARRTTQQLQSRVAELESRLSQRDAIALFCARWGAIPRAGYSFYVTMIQSILDEKPVTFPMVGTDFIRLGNKYFRCHVNGIKHSCVVCCDIHQNDGPRALTCVNPTRTDFPPYMPSNDDESRRIAAYLESWMIERNRKCIRDKSADLHSAVTRADVVIGGEPFAGARFAASIEPVRAEGFVETQCDTIAYFGIGLAPQFKVYCDANKRRHPVDELERAITETEPLIALAIASGMVEYTVPSIIDEIQ